MIRDIAYDIRDTACDVVAGRSIAYEFFLCAHLKDSVKPIIRSRRSSIVIIICLFIFLYFFI